MCEYRLAGFVFENLRKGEGLIRLIKMRVFGKDFNYCKGVANKVISRIYRLQKTCGGWKK